MIALTSADILDILREQLDGRELGNILPGLRLPFTIKADDATLDALRAGAVALRQQPSKCYYQRPQPCKEEHPLDPDYWCRTCGNDMKYYPPDGVGGAITHKQYYDEFVKKLKGEI